jgi:serine/threonine-protein kinase
LHEGAPTKVRPAGDAFAGDAWLPVAGSVIAGRYRIEGVIGKGGMGAVLAAQHVQLDERVAVKFLHPDLARDAESFERFVREAKAATRIKSEHVVRVFDVGTTEQGLPYIVMDLLEGTDLGRLVESGPLPIQLAVDCVLQAAEGLAEAHGAGIVHRDIKPSNLWLSTRRDGSPLVRVLDFGISKLMPANGSEGALTSTQSVFGSPLYMSPEQIRSAKHVDPRTDVWALGVVLHELLTGRPPFDADNVAGVIARIVADAPPRLRDALPSAPVEIERIVHACLEKDPARRAALKDLAAGLRPFGSSVGQTSADRIERVSFGTPSMAPPPMPSSSDLLALSSTEPLITRALAKGSSSPSTSRLGAVVALVVVLALLIGVLTVRSMRATTTPRPLAAVAESAPPPATIPSASPSPPAQAVASVAALVTAPVPEPQPSASASSHAGSRPVVRPSTRPAPPRAASDPSAGTTPGPNPPFSESRK